MDIHDLDEDDLREMEREDLVRAIRESRKKCVLEWDGFRGFDFACGHWEKHAIASQYDYCPSCGKRIEVNE